MRTQSYQDTFELGLYEQTTKTKKSGPSAKELTTQYKEKNGCKEESAMTAGQNAR